MTPERARVICKLHSPQEPDYLVTWSLDDESDIRVVPRSQWYTAAAGKKLRWITVGVTIEEDREIRAHWAKGPPWWTYRDAVYDLANPPELPA